ncbi:hypothetical protein [Acinetobacter baumannii]
MAWLVRSTVLEQSEPRTHQASALLSQLLQPAFGTGAQRRRE